MLTVGGFAGEDVSVKADGIRAHERAPWQYMYAMALRMTGLGYDWIGLD